MTTPERIGPYPIERELGRGGMGIVYLGRDTKLDRAVAIKVLPEVFARDPERLARFEREARLLAALNHPNIGGIYGLEEAEGQRLLALEYLEGETLSDRLKRGPLTVDEALEIARQIAAAVEAAHENGIIHRDLKPSNVKLRRGSEVKVLDFGLAKEAAAHDAHPGYSISPTVIDPAEATALGIIIGTAAYMSPEQARGRQVDRRTDIWSFGCILYECLTGKRLFEGETVSAMIAAILERQPDWSQLPPELPDQIRHLLRRCLKKDPRKRLRDIGDARLDIEETQATRTSDSRIEAVEKEKMAKVRWAAATSSFAWAVAALSMVVAVTALLLPRTPGSVPRGTSTRLSVLPPEGATMVDDAVAIALSPNGETLAFVAVDSSGSSRLWLRPLESLSARALPGTEDARMPFWSPDNRFVAFFSKGKLRKVPAAGGSVEDICVARNGHGGSWSSSGVIIFAPVAQGPLHRVPAAGGESLPVTTLDTRRGESAHRFPCFLPDGRHFLYTALPARAGKYLISAGAVDSPGRDSIMEAGSGPLFAPPGHLVYQRDRILVAQRFDPDRRRTLGDPVPLPDVPGASLTLGFHAATASTNGTLAYLAVAAGNDRTPSITVVQNWAAGLRKQR